ncbi:hypothetical protein SAMN04488074_101880 [Lentzea albidocapillata subsp. violacea]|uniref:DUF6801 domain-containing protein n=1 Tax=Lentzea albidocapillata subsp. violacea TaxID=128104 RepID=A0A1G8S5N9_9PSEU|nr:DUF6801 domain-containing protein [Lentzea albidocapillata]SDJ24483.1 hypothetical protein SAMN04488074_101880 [Lentzea albidocapillata subsp. violacea]
MKTGLFTRAAAVLMVAGALSVATAGTSSAATAELSLIYSCQFSVAGTHDVPTVVTSPDMPDSAAVGVPTAPASATVTSTVSDDVRNTLWWIGGRSVDGTLTTNIAVDNAGSVQNLTSTLTIPNTPVPPSGTFQVVASGTLPALTLANAGTTSINLGNADLALTPRYENGDPTWIGVVHVPCTVVAGQPTKFYEFQVA